MQRRVVAVRDVGVALQDTTTALDRDTRKCVITGQCGVITGHRQDNGVTAESRQDDGRAGKSDIYRHQVAAADRHLHLLHLALFIGASMVTRQDLVSLTNQTIWQGMRKCLA